ncbi:MAG: MNIO family bufferin maturase [Candidatus Omnitrophota bacterium]
MKTRDWTPQGCGIGLRSQHYPVITESWPRMDWFEAISENYMDTGGRPLTILEKVRERYPVALHGTALSIGSADPLNEKYLERLKRLADRVEPFIVSDHLCWSGVNGQQLHDLLPLPFTEETIRFVVPRIERVQDFLGRRILLENISTYVTYRHSTMTEWEFTAEVARRSGCGLLMDINNIYVNSVNHRFDPRDFLKGIPAELVGQIHLSGHTDMGAFLFDTHSKPIIETVWELYEEALKLWGPVSTLIEWDEAIPPYEALAAEAKKAKGIYKNFKKDVSGEDRAPSVPLGASSARDVIELPLEFIQQSLRAKIHALPAEKTLFRRDFLNPQGGAVGEERMSVYADGYPLRVRESLAEVFDAVHHVLGDERFKEVSFAYADKFGAEDYNLNYAGRHFAEYLADSAFRKNFPFLADLAKLEWLIWEAFHAFDGPPLSPERIAGIPLEEWEGARIRFQPSVQLVSSVWPVLDVWRARKDDPGKVKIDGTQSQRVLVGRSGLEVRCEPLKENQYRLLEALLAGKSLGEACEELAGLEGSEELPITAWFSGWLSSGLIAGCEFSVLK